MWLDNLTDIGDGKVVTGESVASSHQMVMCRMSLGVRKRKRAKVKQRIIWWKLNECCEDFRERWRQAQGGCLELPDDWVITPTMIGEVFGVSSGE